MGDSLAGTLLAVQPRNLQALTRGAIVELRGLPNATLNGEIGKVNELTPTAQGSTIARYNVAMRDDNVKAVKCSNLLARSGLWDISASQSHEYLQWRTEQCCLFIDSNGYHKKFWLHMPCQFDVLQKNQEDSIKEWPLLIYMHGAGGTSFLTQSKKSVKSVGLQYAA